MCDLADCAKSISIFEGTIDWMHSVANISYSCWQQLRVVSIRLLWLLIDPVEAVVLVADDLTLLEPESDLLLCRLDTV